MSKQRLLSALDESESAGCGNNFDHARIKKRLEKILINQEIVFKAKNKKSQKKPLRNRKLKESSEIKNKRD